MSGVIFFETLRRTWKATLGWAVGVALMALYVVVAVPDSKAIAQYGELLKTTPKFMTLLFGGDMAMFATPEGLFGALFFSWIMMVLATYGVIAGLSITANDEDRGILDVMIALPIPRWRIVVEKFGAYTVNAIVIALVTAIMIWASTLNSEVFKLAPDRILLASLNLIPSVLLMTGFTAFVATLVRRRSTALAIAGGFVVVSYLLDVIGRSAADGRGLGALSFFTYFDGTSSLAKGVSLGGMVLLTVVAVAFISGATALFQRRDVGL